VHDDLTVIKMETVLFRFGGLSSPDSDFIIATTNTAELLSQENPKNHWECTISTYRHGRWQTLLRPSSRLSVCALFWGKYCRCLAINASGKRLRDALGYPQF
jgi:hypothetical protein